MPLKMWLAPILGPTFSDGCSVARGHVFASGGRIWLHHLLSGQRNNEFGNKRFLPCQPRMVSVLCDGGQVVTTNLWIDRMNQSRKTKGLGSILQIRSFLSIRLPYDNPTLISGLLLLHRNLELCSPAEGCRPGHSSSPESMR